MGAQRTQEIGLRMAMGATMGDVLLLVARRGIGLVAGGIVVGLAASLAARHAARIDPARALRDG